MQKQINQPISDQKEKEETKDTPAEGKQPTAIRTLKGDISKYMKEGNVSLIDIATQSLKQRTFNQESDQSKKIFFLAIGAIIFLIGLVFGAWFLFFGQNSSEEKNIQYSSVISFEKEKIISLETEQRSELIDSIKKIRSSDVPLGSVLSIPISLGAEGSKKFIDAKDFFEILRILPPGDFIQSIDSSFSLGSFYLKNDNIFLVFKIRSFELAARGALDWEKNMAKDFSDIFQINIPENNQIYFQDKIIKNHDARILYDSQNNPILIYAIINKKYFILTADLDTFEEAAQRLSLKN